MLHWPGWRQLCVSIVCGLAVFCLFAFVYGGANWLAGQHSWRVAVHTPLDLTIPFIPAMTPVYLSLTPLLWFMAFVLRSTAEVVAFVGTLAVATLVAGVCFVLLPAEHAYPAVTPAELGPWQPAYELLRAMVLDHNYFPSLHVAFTTISVRVAVRRAAVVSGLLFGLWGGAVIVSTLLVHEHYVSDVATGLLLGWVSVSLCYDKWLRSLQSRVEQTIAPSPTSDPARTA